MEKIIWWFVLGGITWAVSVGVKIVLSGLVDIGVRKKVSDTFYAALQGLLSAFTELGVAALVLIYILPEGTLMYIVSFGAGAGITEALILLVVALISKKENKKELLWYQEWTFAIERCGALLGHIGSRGLVWLSLHGSLYPFVFAIIGFAVVDGIATYGTLKEWNWLEPRTWKRFYGLVTLVGIIEIALLFGIYFL